MIKGNMFDSRMVQMEYLDRMKELENENHSLKEQLKSLKIENKEILAEFGEFVVHKGAKENEQRKSEFFQQMAQSSPPKRCAATNYNGVMISKNKGTDEFQTGGLQNSGDATRRERKKFQKPASSTNVKPREKTSGGEGSNHSGERTSVNGANVMTLPAGNGMNNGSSTRQSFDDIPFSVQQDYSNAPEHISLGNVPPTSVATILYNNYVFFLLSLAQNLLSSDVTKLKDWANQNFSINNPQNDADVLFQLDQKGVINSSELSRLRHFFESIDRIDLVCVIDAFLLGDYSLLREISTPKKSHSSRSQPIHNGATSSRYQSLFNTGKSSVISPTSGTLQRNVQRNTDTSREPASSKESQSSFTQNPAISNLWNDSKQMLLARSPNENHSSPHEQQNPGRTSTGLSPRIADTVVVDGPVTNERATASSSTTRIDHPVPNGERNMQTVGSNGSKLSKFQRPDTRPSNAWFQDENWLCSHYKRHCYVKFECCDQFWPCHRCHNNQSSCGRRKLKSRDTQMVKCVYCNKVQQFGQFCCDCGAQFANYYCGLCKHLTGRDDHPYHCEKCGICRIHGDRSFHCNICGVCLDVQLRGNHRCREGSAHDECCICLEDAFTGCQILPCSHKVHKECATQMIRSGITRCPICRESFAHKLERRPPNSGKHPGNGK